MSTCQNNQANINETFIIEPIFVGGETITACTAVYTNLLNSCSGDTSIELGTSNITFNGNILGSGSISANTFNSNAYFSGGTNILELFSTQQSSITGGTFEDATLSLNKNDNTQIKITGFTDTYTTGATLNNNVIDFERNDGTTYSVDLSSFSGSGGISSLSVIGSTPNANAATLSGSVLNLEPASELFGGVLTTGSQTIAGDKTFKGDIILADSGTGDNSDSRKIIFFAKGGTGNEQTGSIILDGFGGATGQSIKFFIGTANPFAVANNGIITSNMSSVVSAGLGLFANSTTAGFRLINSYEQTSGNLFSLFNSSTQARLQIRYDGQITAHGLSGTGTQVVTADINGVLSKTPISTFISVAGSDKQVQFNDGGVFGASTNFFYDKTNSYLYIGTPSVSAYTTGATLIVNGGQIKNPVGGLNFAPIDATYFSGLKSGTNSNAFEFISAGNQVMTVSPSSVGISADVFGIGLRIDRILYGSPAQGTKQNVSLEIKGNNNNNVSNTTSYTQLLIDPIINQTGSDSSQKGTGTIRGIYYNPTIVDLHTSPHYAIETTSGNVKFGNLAGTGTRMVTVDSTGLIGTGYISAITSTLQSVTQLGNTTTLPIVVQNMTLSNSGNTMVIGDTAHVSTTADTYSVVIGQGAARDSGLLNRSLFIGSSAFRNGGNNAYSVGIGYDSMFGYSGNSGFNTSVGAISGRFSSGNNNINLGMSAGVSSVNSQRNIFIGNLAGSNITNISNNISIGHNTLCDTITSLSNNIVIGHNSMSGGTSNRIISIGHANRSTDNDNIILGNSVNLSAGTNQFVVKTSTNKQVNFNLSEITNPINATLQNKSGTLAYLSDITGSTGSTSVSGIYIPTPIPYSQIKSSFAVNFNGRAPHTKNDPLPPSITDSWDERMLCLTYNANDLTFLNYNPRYFLFVYKSNITNKSNTNPNKHSNKKFKSSFIHPPSYSYDWDSRTTTTLGSYSNFSTPSIDEISFFDSGYNSFITEWDVASNIGKQTILSGFNPSRFYTNTQSKERGREIFPFAYDDRFVYSITGTRGKYSTNMKKPNFNLYLKFAIVINDPANPNRYIMGPFSETIKIFPVLGYFDDGINQDQPYYYAWGVKRA